MRLDVDACARQRELTAYLVVGDLDAARRLTARAGTLEELVPVLLRLSPPSVVATPRPAPAPRVAAFWGWLLRLPVADRVALVTFSRHGWAYDDLDPLLGDAARVLGSDGSPRQAAAVLAAAFDALLPSWPGSPDRPPARAGAITRRRAGAGVVLAATLLGASVAVLTIGPAADPRPGTPVEAPTQALPRPLARPIANYESLAVVPGMQWDLPDRGGDRRSAPPWLR